MTQVLVAFLCLSSAASGALVAWSVTHQPIGHVIRDRVRRRLVVTLKTGQGYRGILAEADHHAIVLQSAELLNRDGSSVAVDGELLILRGDVGYIQLP